MLSEIDKLILSKIVTSDTHVSGAFLGEICNSSINTIRKEIDLINDYLKEHACHIETKVATGYSFIIDDETIAKPFLDQFLQNIRRFKYLNFSEYSNVYYIIRRFLLHSDYISIDT